MEYQDYILVDSGSSFLVGEVLNSQRMLEHGAIVLSASGCSEGMEFGGIRMLERGIRRVVCLFVVPFDVG